MTLPRLSQASLEWWVADRMMFRYKECWKHSGLMCHSNGLSAVPLSVFLTFCVCLQFDFVELLDGRRLLARDVHGLEGPVALQRSLVPITSHNTGFIQYMDSGIWHLAIYNDGKETETVSFLTTAMGECPGHDLLLNRVIAIHIIPTIPTSCPPQQTGLTWGLSQRRFLLLADFNGWSQCRLIKVKLNMTKIRTSLLSCHAPE